MTNKTFKITPAVNHAREFVEIANDFSNPLEIVREMISNAFDAGAKNIDIVFSVEKNDEGKETVKIVFEDDGSGISKDEMHNFFDLGNSSRRDDESAIGEKGHGTKVAFNSSCIEVDSVSRKHPDVRIIAKVLNPLAQMNNDNMPEVECEILDGSGKAAYTKITVWGYNRDDREQFHHDTLRDYIYWHTKFGSFEVLFEEEKHKDVVINLQGLSPPNGKPEQLSFGHQFPPQSKSVDELFNEHLADAPDYFCRHFKEEGSLRKFPEIKYQAFFSVEGKHVKRSYNKMLRVSGRSIDGVGYRVRDKYGLWLCKDFIPVQTENDWVSQKGGEFTRLHAFFNCQGFRLTANRGSVNNTDSEKMAAIKEVVKKIYDEICSTQDWKSLEWLESQVAGYKASEREDSEYRKRIRDINRTKVAPYKGCLLVEPLSESGVYGLVATLLAVDPDILPFAILDYNTRVGIDLIVYGTDGGNMSNSAPFYAELKYSLGKDMNHSFEHIDTIVCWDTKVQGRDEVVDVKDHRRLMKVVSPGKGQEGYTKYFLDADASARKIECIVLKQYLKERWGIEFRSRTEEEQIPDRG